MQNPTSIRSSRWLTALLLLGLASSFVLHHACSATTLPFLQHFKHPMSVATVKIVNGNSAKYQMYVANADIDKLAVVDVGQRSLVIDPDNNTPGILYIPTGRRPIDVKASPDQTRLYVLHAIDGNIRVYDTSTNTPINNNPMLPTNCARQPGCWSGPVRLLVYQQQNPSQLIGYVALSGENAVAVINLNESDSANFGKEISRIRLSGRPADMWFGPENKNIYVADSSQGFVHVIEAETQSVRQLAVGAPSLNGSVSLDNRWLYLVDARDNSIMIYDLQENKTVSQGDERFPNETNIRLTNASFLQVKFVPTISISVRDEEGGTRVITKSFAWANGSDGYGYLIDPDEYTNSKSDTKFKAHRLLDNDEGGPSVGNIRVLIDGENRGDPRNPQQPFIPRLVTSESDQDGIILSHGKTRTESWSLTYEGKIIEERAGRFSNIDGGIFADVEQKDLASLGVKAKDLLVLQNCGTAVSVPDAGTISEEAPPVPTCDLEITKVEGYRVFVDTSSLPAESKNQAQWGYTIRSNKSYVAVGSVTGVISTRIPEGALFIGDFFTLTVESNTQATPRDTSIQFDTTSGVSIKRVRMGGLPTLIIPQANHVSCGGTLCQQQSCTTHPSCTNTQCEANTADATKQCGTDESCNNGQCEPNTKLWILDSAGGRLFVVNPTDAVTLETTIR
ncbi:MAG: hypothetical protein EP343_24265 [Deltaproteobacteria bacterium]|nr:MAG: hypothetical protein EP343_24265 [Deltaproteobacteria bacterium]